MARIVVIDDDAVIRHQARRILESRGHVVEVAEDGAAGMACILERPPDLVITDMVLYVSGYTDDAIVRHRMLEPGLNFLQKPFTPATLAKKVRDVLDAK